MKLFTLIFSILFFLYLYAESLHSYNWLNKTNNFIKIINTKKENNLTLKEISNGLKEALKVGSENVIKKIGRINGFYKDKNIHIPLPDKLKKSKKILSKFGMSNYFKELELKLNRAAELATPKAKKVFFNTISQMTFNDIKKIYKGPDNAATIYFRKKMSNPLTIEMKPIIDDSLNQVKAVQLYNSIIKKYNSIPFLKPIEFDLSQFVLEKSLNGIFYYLEKEEAAIRHNPAKRTTDILKKVFGVK